MITSKSVRWLAAFILLGCICSSAMAAEKDAKGERKVNQYGVYPPNPGLDGGKGGHWGLKGEKDWVDSRWNKMDVGPFVSSTLDTPAGTVKKSIAVRLGDKQEASVCFDTSFMSYRAGWLGGFVSFSGKRFGLIDRPKITGRVQWTSPRGPGWVSRDLVRYRGLYLVGKRVIFSYQIGTTYVLDAPWAETYSGNTVFTRTFQVSAGRTDLQMMVANADAKVVLRHNDDDISLRKEKGRWVVHIGPRTTPVRATLVIASGRARTGTFERALPNIGAPTQDLTSAAKPGKAIWKPLTTKGVRSTRDGAYVIDTLTVPYENPYKALMFFSGIDFFSNGDAAVSTVHGDVWLVSGIDDKLEKLTWKRYATGLFQPLGLRVISDRIYVLGRDQITVLYDRNKDGQADYYESFRQIRTSLGGHEYATCLESDKDGTFYYLDPIGLHSVSRTGAQTKLIASGWRYPNGMSIGPDGSITVAPQEGNWTPASTIDLIPPGSKGMYFGAKGPKKDSNRPEGYDAHMVYLPRHIDNSSGSQVWVTSEKWGPLQGQLLSLSYGRSELLLILRDKVAGKTQGSVVRMGLRFSSGAMRGRFGPTDGQLYVAGMRGWSTNAVQDGCLQRVRYTGQKFNRPIKWKAYIGGVQITFARELDPELAQDLESYSAERWNYRYSEKYGSDEYSVKDSNLIGHDPVKIEAARLLADGKSVFLDIPKMSKAHVMQVRYDLEAKGGDELVGSIFATIHKLDIPR